MANWPAGPLGNGACWMSVLSCAPFSVMYLSGLRNASRYIDAPLSVAQIFCDRNARLLLVSSQARPPSSWASFQKAVMNLTDSITSFLLILTVLPSFSTSVPPHDHM